MAHSRMREKITGYAAYFQQQRHVKKYEGMKVFRVATVVTQTSGRAQGLADEFRGMMPAAWLAARPVIAFENLVTMRSCPSSFTQRKRDSAKRRVSYTTFGCSFLPLPPRVKPASGSLSRSKRILDQTVRFLRAECDPLRSVLPECAGEPLDKAAHAPASGEACARLEVAAPLRGIDQTLFLLKPVPIDGKADRP